MDKALFLDRDGVVNIDTKYAYKIEGFVFNEDIFPLCEHFQSLGYKIIIITNQSGVARGYYTQEDYEKLTTWVIEKFAQKNISITDVYACFHHPNDHCKCRKPQPGMIFDAQKKHNIDLQNSILVGDNETDIEAGLNAGIKHNYLLSKNVTHSKAKKIIKSLKELIHQQQ